MLAASFKRTKIVATIGPASNSPEILEELIKSGVNMVRLNMSHGTQDEHAAVVKLTRELSAKHDKPVAVLADLQGPRIRVGILPADGVPFIRGNVARFQFGTDYEGSGIIPVQHDISKYLKPGERIYLRDGVIQVEVKKVDKGLITATVLTPGLLFSNQGMNLPDSDMGGDILTPKDISDLAWAVKNDADYIGLSFVQRASDITSLKARLKKLDADQLVIAKIETAAAVENLEAIVAVTDAIMVARGDLATETKPEAVPATQRRLVELSRRAGKPVIVATQMLESMMQSAQPLRAEVSDVATAVLEAADAVMLSGETAGGLFPVETVQMMKRIILYTEREERTQVASADELLSGSNAISAAAVVLARHLPAKIIIAETATGQTARNVSALRPEVPIIMVTNNRRVYHQLAIVWGGKSYLHAKPADATAHVIRQLRGAGNVVKGDALVVASGHQPGITGGTDTVSIQMVQ